MNIPECGAVLCGVLAVAAGVQQFLLCAEVAALIGTYHGAQKCGTEETLRNYALR